MSELRQSPPENAADAPLAADSASAATEAQLQFPDLLPPHEGQKLQISSPPTNSHSILPADVSGREPLAKELRSEGLAELAHWKAQLRQELESWLEELDQIPDLEPQGQAPDVPDLYSFYAQWIAANAEAKRNNRRTAEAFSQWGDTLGRFDGDLKLLREQLQRLLAEVSAGGLSRAHCLVLVELLDRLQRVAAAFGAPPPAGWFGGAGRWRRAWESQRQALEIVVGHFTELLKKEGVTRIDTAGLAFDSSTMVAVAAEPNATRPDQSVLEELAPGYRLRGELLRPAHVKVSLNKSRDSTP